jgi:hypothetical protein
MDCFLLVNVIGEGEVEKYVIRNNEGKWVEVSKEQLMRMSLEDSNALPATNGNVTMIHNYIGTFWSHILQPRNFAVFFQLIKHCFGDKHFAWPSVNTIADDCGITRKTAVTALDELEGYGLCKKALVYNEDKNVNETNIYIVRRTVPFISKELYDKFPKRMRDKHDKFIQNLKTSEHVEFHQDLNFKQSYNQQVTMDRLRKNTSQSQQSEEDFLKSISPSPGYNWLNS